MILFRITVIPIVMLFQLATHTKTFIDANLIICVSIQGLCFIGWKVSRKHTLSQPCYLVFPSDDITRLPADDLLTSRFRKYFC